MTTYKIISGDRTPESCLECGTAFYGRPNRKFCCDTCKNRFHNRRQQGIRNLKLRVRTIMEKNHAVLSMLLKENKSSMDMADLMVLGYNPNYITSIHKSSRFSMCTCYDISFLSTPTRIYNIHKVEDAECMSQPG